MSTNNRKNHKSKQSLLSFNIILTCSFTHICIYLLSQQFIKTFIPKSIIKTVLESPLDSIPL